VGNDPREDLPAVSDQLSAISQKKTLRSQSPRPKADG
jgi:hypothetical protein